MTSTDKAPERIWVWGEPVPVYCSTVDPRSQRKATEYVRADLHDAAQARNEELEGALRPFADEADAWEGYASEERLVEGFGEYNGKITVADCRNARAALQRKEGDA